MVVFINVKKEDVLKLIKKGFQAEETKTIYEELRLKNKINNLKVILYTSGKLHLQGKDKEIKELEKYLLSLGLTKTGSLKLKKETGWVIGSDEALKGDTFGGLVVAGVKADDKIRDLLKEIGVADSKTLSDNEVLYLAEKIKKVAPCEIRSLLPKEYNELKNVTLMLNKLHQEVGEFLKPGVQIVDKYPGCKIGTVREEKAESLYLEVAAASILARSAALHQLNYLSTISGFQVPKGSTHVKLALMELKERKLEFKTFVKLHFSNVQKFLNENFIDQK